MFGGVRQNSIFYILEKTDDGLDIKTGQVVNVSNPQPKYNQYGGATPSFNSQPEMVVDIKVRVGDEDVDFKQLNTSLSIANSGSVIVSDNREAISAEVDGIVAMSKQHIDATPYHERIVKTSDEVKRIINPQFRKEKEQEEKMNMLEDEVTGIKETLGEMMNMLSSALGQSKPKSKKEE